MKSLSVLQPICCASDAPPMPREAAEELAATFKALADPTRVAIVNRLTTAEAVCVCDLTAAFELSQPTISHHLRILRDAGLVEAERRGTWAYYRLVPDAIDALRERLRARGERRARGAVRLRAQRRPQPDGRRPRRAPLGRAHPRPLGRERARRRDQPRRGRGDGASSAST